MVYDIAADVVVAFHLLFIIFVIAGGLLLFVKRWVAWFHLPAVVWAVMIEWKGWICPLTPLENYLRYKAQGSGYEGGFIGHYLLPIVYPAGLTQEIQYFLGALVIAVNLLFYGGYTVFSLRKK
ncbi:MULTISPECIES: DUF2784 domain-containing protein [unclassified Prosthecochloris]|uniref:DUF2784 domain-containing protein n=1 Tax=unclassified Prosthecochloris TaxID=2632826 RepID=UPI00223DFCEE|nr:MULTISPECIES: DUF2784 domain-containing protein [unclassified Prosthecochloris]UZJ36900.1 DUF2784 domain-containing protein [Prosthecochloris sp. SCSIO W1103]UZJ39841.1 DUF2784 domain-containing protein [Prosthecochloris sp. SCSIO W1102]